MKPWEGTAWGNAFVIHGEGEVVGDIRSGTFISKYIVHQVKLVIPTTGTAVSPAHFVVVVVRLNPQDGTALVVAFAIKGEGGSQKMAGQGGLDSTR